MPSLIKNRYEAGKLLAHKLIKYKHQLDTIVLGLPRGGVPVAYEIAMYLELPLDVLIVRKIGFPSNEEYAIGAISLNDVFVKNPEIEYSIDFNSDAIQKIINREKKELLRRNQIYRNNKPMPCLKNKHIILVDDGVATGSSIKAALHTLKQFEPQEIILAVPVLPLYTFETLSSLINDLIYLYTPEPFYGVGRWYESFPQTSDSEVIELLNKAQIHYVKRRAL
ncbi:MAG: phosphoribosyltransferase [Neisseriaceae bacterium]